LPRHFWKFLRRRRRRFGLNHFQLGIGCRLGFAGNSFICFPGSDPGLQTVVLGGFFVAGFHIKKREVGMNQLLMWPEALSFVAFRDSSGVVALAEVPHAQSQLCVEMLRVSGKEALEL